jgi:nitroimidazol reductase NimA-like FMN-containing flavoprotein (pyridoxamine 5'-phosphate oxidase superfamily)
VSGKVLLVKGHMGLGNRIEALLNGILYARLSGRRLIVDWSDPIYSDAGENVFHQLFHCDLCDPADRIPDTDSVAPPPWRGRLHASVADLQAELGKAYRTTTSIDLSRLDPPEEVAVLWGFDQQIHRMRPHFRGDFAALAADKTPILLRRLLQEDLLLQPAIRARVEAFRRAHLGQPTAGIHVRYSDHRSRLRPTLDRVDRLLRKRPGLRLFLATDSLPIRTLFEERYGAVLGTEHWFPEPGLPIHGNPAAPSRAAGAADALVDLYLLSACDVLVVDASSSFAHLAVLLSNAPKPSIHRVAPRGKGSMQWHRRKWRLLRALGFFHWRLRLLRAGDRLRRTGAWASRDRDRSGPSDGAVPRDRPAQPLAEVGARAEAEGQLGTLGVHGAARLAVGLAGIPDDLAREAGLARDLLRQLADPDLAARAEVHRLGRVVALRRQHDALGGVVDVEEVARRRARAPGLDHALAALDRLDALPDQRGDHVRGARIEVVAGAVQIGGQERDRVQAVLGAVRLRLHQERALRDAVRRVGLLGIAVPQLLLLERHRRVLRIGADRADQHELLHAVNARALDHLRAHHQVLVEEAAGALAVGADPADDRREVDHELGPQLAVQARHVLAPHHVIVLAARRRDLAAAEPAQVSDHAPAQEAGAARDADPALGERRAVGGRRHGGHGTVGRANTRRPEMSRRDQIQMSSAEVDAFLEETRTLVLVSNGPGGFPHPMPMWFARDPDGTIHMTTFAKSQKVRNLERDPRVSMLAESGTEYAKLRGVVLYGRVELVRDAERVLAVMKRASRVDPAALPESQRAGAEAVMRAQAAKRVAIRCKPERIVSWDHAKLGGAY